MGCGQSKIGIYQRKSKNKKNGSKRSGENDEKDGETEDGEDTIITRDEKDSGSIEKGDEDADSVTSKIKQIAQQQTGGAVLAQSEISSSQLDFFKMLDEKIENGPDYEESDEEEQKARMASLLQEWKAACQARQQKKIEAAEQQEKWSSPSRGGKPIYQDDYGNYAGKRINLLATAAQRFPAPYASSPGNNIPVGGSYKMNSPTYVDQTRKQIRNPIIGNYHAYQPSTETYNHCDASVPPGHPIDPLNPLRPQVLLRQSSINSQVQQYPENQRLHPESIRQFTDFSRPYHDQRPYQISRPMPAVNVLYEHRLYGVDANIRPQQIYQEDPARQGEEVQRVMTDISRQYVDPQRPDATRQVFGTVEDQRIYHDRLLEKPRQYLDGTRALEGSRAPVLFQKPSLIAQRSVADPTRSYRDLESEECSFPRQERFSGDPMLDDSSTYRPYNPSHFKSGRSLSVEVHYLSGPPPPREMIPLQGAPGPPQGSPRPMVPRGLQPNVHRLPANSVVHFRKPQGAFT